MKNEQGSSSCGPKSADRIRAVLMEGPSTIAEIAVTVGDDARAVKSRLSYMRKAGLVRAFGTLGSTGGVIYELTAQGLERVGPELRKWMARTESEDRQEEGLA